MCKIIDGIGCGRLLRSIRGSQTGQEPKGDFLGSLRPARDSSSMRIENVKSFKFN